MRKPVLEYRLDNKPKETSAGLSSEEAKELWDIPKVGEEKGVVELKHDIGRLQRKKQEELQKIIDEVTARVKKMFEETFVKKSNESKGAADGSLRIFEQLNFWKKKRQATQQERQYAEGAVEQEELDVQLKFIDKRVEAYSRRCERYKRRCQAQLDSIIKLREKELVELYANISDFLNSRETVDEDDAEVDAEEDEEELTTIAKGSLK